MRKPTRHNEDIAEIARYMLDNGMPARIMIGVNRSLVGTQRKVQLGTTLEKEGYGTVIDNDPWCPSLYLEIKSSEMAALLRRRVDEKDPKLDGIVIMEVDRMDVVPHGYGPRDVSPYS